MARRLYFTPGSPFGRAIRVMLDEIGLKWSPELANIGDTLEERARRAPTLQVPTLFDGDTVLWDSGVIAEYLLASYGERRIEDGRSMAAALARDHCLWADRRLFATVQTLGASIVLVSQTRWSGTTVHDNAFIARNGTRALGLMDWFETQLDSESDGFWPGTLSVQDIFCVCHIMFMTHRPLEIEWDRSRTPKLAALCDRLSQRESFERNGVEWWEPGMPT